MIDRRPWEPSFSFFLLASRNETIQAESEVRIFILPPTKAILEDDENGRKTSLITFSHFFPLTPPSTPEEKCTTNANSTTRVPIIAHIFDRLALFRSEPPAPPTSTRTSPTSTIAVLVLFVFVFKVPDTLLIHFSRSAEPLTIHTKLIRHSAARYQCSTSTLVFHESTDRPTEAHATRRKMRFFPEKGVFSEPHSARHALKTVHVKRCKCVWLTLLSPQELELLSSSSSTFSRTEFVR